jgi:hypothetical protein
VLVAFSAEISDKQVRALSKQAHVGLFAHPFALSFHGGAAVERISLTLADTLLFGG